MFKILQPSSLQDNDKLWVMEYDIPSMVLWADEAILVVNKPAGLRSVPDGYQRDAPYLRSALEPEYGGLWTVHRLDKDTSGIVVLARSAQAHRLLNAQFQEHTVEKTYHALVIGSPDWEEQHVDAPLLPNGDRRHRTVVDPQWGKPALTGFRLLERFEGYALVEAAPHTGRPHQIRAHLAYLGFPILSDALYGGKEIETGGLSIARLALHARSLAFQHPTEGERRVFTAPYPEDFWEMLKRD